MRIVALCVAVLCIVPAGVMSMRQMLNLRSDDASPGTRALEALWSVIPVVGLLGLLFWAGLV
jgi:heme/copper-type cytochrome/quinol oxidase subunit 2